MSDQQQRDEALNITQSFIVQAPAGSGKTELLAQRYLKLLAQCAEPENMMAMTFTNKAVDELSERVLSALKSTTQPRPKLPHKQLTYDLATQAMQQSKAQNWQLLQNPKRLKISTIDGLSSLISSRYPLPSQLVPRQIMAQQWERDEAYQFAAMQTLLMIDDAQQGGEIAHLLLYLDNNVGRFYRLITKMLSKRDQWLTRLYRGGVLDATILKHSAEKIITQHLTALEQLAKPHLTSDFFALLSVNTQIECAAIKALPGHQVSDLAAWQTLRELCLIKSGTWRKSLTKNNGFPSDLKAQKQDFLALLTAFSGNESLRLALDQVTQLPDVDFAQTQSETLITLAKVLKLCVAQLHLYFEQQQAHDFIEVALGANQALDEQTGISDIALFLDYKVQHLLIDEFQDTATSQFNTLEKLIAPWQAGDGKTLFLVGDPMQSIYRFRESQVGLFLQVKAQGIANIKPVSLVLSTNFRSSKSIVETNNTFFQTIFPDKDDIYQGAIAYADSTPNSKAEHPQAVTFYPFAHNQRVLEAQQVASIVEQTLADNADGELAILVRNRSHLKAIAHQLQHRNIAFESLKVTPLKNHILTRDLFSLTKALLHLGDKLAWLSVLRTPWCGMILDDVLVLSADHLIVYEQLNNPKCLHKLSPEGQQRAQHLHQCLSDAIHHQGRFSFVELLTHALNQLGVTRALSATEAHIKDQYLQIVFDCEQQQKLNPQTLEAALDNLYAPSEKAKVKLMTIHQSKGLEFDTVIIPGLGQKPRNDDAPIMHMKEFAGQSLLLAPIKSSVECQQSNTYTYLKFVDSQQNKFETMRLLYVAMTRAKNRLHLLGAVGRTKKATAASLLHLLMPFYRSHFVDIDETQDEDQDLGAPKLQRFSQQSTPVVTPQAPGESVEYQQNSERLFKSMLGTLVHHYCQYEQFSPSPESIDVRLIEIGVAPNEMQKWRHFVLKMLNNTRQDVQFDWLFKARDSTLVEAQFVVENQSITLDRLFIEDDILWIIDFKTAELAPNETLDGFILRQQSSHAKQLLLYQEALSKIYANEIKCALYCPAVSQLIEIKR